MGMFQYVLQEWFERELPELVDRNFDYEQYEEVDAILTLVGVRRSGKTYTMYKIAKELMNKGVKKENIIYVNFEDERLYPITASELSELIKTYREHYETTGMIYLLLDEIQNIEGWERWVRRIFDTEKNIKIVISGSSSKLLPEEIANELRGRTIVHEIFPFSFEEFLNARNFDYKNIEYSPRKPELLRLLREYLKYGGFPAVALAKTKKFEMLQDYFKAIFFRDVVERYKVRNIELLEELARVVINNAGSLFSYSKTANYLKSLGFKVGKATIREYMRYFQSCYLLFEVPIFSYNIKDRAQYPRKIYAIDTGLKNALSWGEDWGRICESAVFLKLRRERKNVYYWKSKDGYEVDFVLREGAKVKSLLQVTYDMEDEKTRKREVRGLLKASKELKCNNLKIITWDYESEEEVEGKKIKYVPLWKFLLI